MVPGKAVSKAAIGATRFNEYAAENAVKFMLHPFNVETLSWGHKNIALVVLTPWGF